MLYIKFLCLLFVLQATLSFAEEPEANILVFKGGNVEINASINQYENITPGTPIQGSIMVTHDAGNPVDQETFVLGEKPLQVTWVQSVPMSADNKLEVSIYSFQLPGMPQGYYTLPQIGAKVGGKYYYAPPLSLQVGNNL